MTDKVKDLQVPATLSSLIGSVDDLEKLIASLIERLDPVLNESGEKDLDEDENLGGLVPLAKNIHDLFVRCDRLSRSVQSALRRLEI